MPVLVVEDHEETRELVARLLKQEGHEVIVAGDVKSARAALAATPPDAMVLDWMLPDGSGGDLCRSLRSAGNWLPILVLTARGEVEDRVAGLDAGADDYLRKPFAAAELVARVRALLRRGTRVDDVLRVGSAEIRLAERRLLVDGRDVPVTAREFAILEVLARNRGSAVSRSAITEAAWGDDSVGAEASLEVLVARLRRKLRAEGGPDPIRTLRGFGYALACDP